MVRPLHRARHARSPGKPRTRRLALAAASCVLAVSGISALVAATGQSAARASATCVPDYVFSNGTGIAEATNCASSLVQLVSGAKYDEPALSPDGSEIALVGDTTGTNGIHTSEVFVMPAQPGSTPAQVTHLGGIVWGVNWSPDSQHLVLSDGPGIIGHIYTVDRNGVNLTPLDPTFEAEQPAWCGSKIVAAHPDGTTVGGAPSHLYSMNAADGGDITQITSTGVIANSPACSPDNNWVFYSSTSTPDPVTSLESIYAAPIITAGAAVQLTAPTHAIQVEPSISSDWTLAYFSGATSNLVFQWLGGTSPIAAPTAAPFGTYAEFPTFARGNGSTPPPAGFPIAYGSPAPSPSPTPTSTEPSPTPSPTASCPPVKFFGVRGSGETASDFGGLGYTIQNVANAFADQIPRADVTAIDYPAVAFGYSWQDYGVSYKNSVAAGIAALQTAILIFHNKCPTTYMVLAGYSQGAHVVGDTYQQLSSSQRKYVAAAVMMGDPRFNHKQKHGVNVGSFNALDGIYSLFQKPRDISGSEVDAVRSACIGGDPVCNSSPSNSASCAVNLKLNQCPHLLYVDQGWAERLGLWAAARIP